MPGGPGKPFCPISPWGRKERNQTNVRRFREKQYITALGFVLTTSVYSGPSSTSPINYITFYRKQWCSKMLKPQNPLQKNLALNPNINKSEAELVGISKRVAL